MNKTTAIYARVSSDKQAQEGTIESQISSLREHCVSQGYQIEEDLVFTDNGVSGTTLVRPGLDALRDKAVAGEVNQILILCPDRLARKYAHQLILVEEFKKLGVEINFANRTISTSPEDQLLFQIQGVISEFEREKIIERSRRGKLYKAKAGKVSVLSGAPYGYVYISATESEECRYEIHPEEATVVKRIFHRYIYDRKSIGAIARELTTEGIPSRHNVGHWERSVIWLMLKNPAYCGKAAYRKTQVVERLRPTKLARDNGFYPKKPKSSTRDRDPKDWIIIAVPQIVSEEDFEKAKAQLQENKKLSPRNNKRYEYLLSGLLRCKECGYSIYGKPASNSKYKRLYYRCMGQDGHRWPTGRVCSSHPVRVEVLDELVWQQVQTLIEQPEIVVKEYTRRMDAKKKEDSNYETLLSKKKKEIRMQEQQKERLLDLYQVGTLNLAEVEERLKTLRLRITKLNNECALLNQEEKQKQQCLQLVEQFEDFKKKMNLNLPNLKFEEKKQLVRLLVSEVVVDVKNQDVNVKHVVPVQKNVPLCLGSNGTPLRGSFFRCLPWFQFFYEPCLKKGRDQLEDSRIDNFIFEHTDKFSMLNFVKKGLNICIEDMPVFESGIGHTGRALGSAFPGAKSEGEFFKLQLINGLHNQDEGSLDHSVFQRWDSQGAFSSIAFGNIDSSHSLGLERFRFHFSCEIFDKVPPLTFDRANRDSIDARGSIVFNDEVKGFSQKEGIHQIAIEVPVFSILICMISDVVLNVQSVRRQ